MMPWRTVWNARNEKALLGLAVVNDIRIRPSLADLGDTLLSAASSPPDKVESHDIAIRNLLRTGGFKPAGRNRPAQEYLARLAESEGGLQTISNAVDVNNIISLRYRLPASVVKASVLPGGVIVREGQPGESYVFNASGQELRLEGLLCLCSLDEQPVASPVKDAFSSHVDDATTDVVACVYSSVEITPPESLTAILDEYIALLLEYCGGSLSTRLIARVD